MEGVTWPIPELRDCYLKKIFPSMLPNTFLDFILDMGVTELLEVIYFARNIYETETVTSGLLYQRLNLS